KTVEKKIRIKILFRFYIHLIIENIKKITLLSEYINLLTIKVKSEKVDQKISVFKI
ncbi:hypothetical protein EMPG_10621, partial [Blastomyces silverae]